MGKFKTLSGKFKDEASQMKLNMVHLCNSENVKTIHLALLKATSHTSHNPPLDKYVKFLQSTVETCYGPETVGAIVQRLRLTTDVCVAAKCLQSEYGYNGECSHRDNSNHRNLIYNRGSHLKLNDLNKNSSRFIIELFPWVQWYKQYIDCYLSSAEAIGVTPNIKEKSEDKRLESQRVSSFTTECIFTQINFLENLFEHISARPKTLTSKLNKIIVEMKELMVQDYFSVLKLIKIRLEKLNERIVKPSELVKISVRFEKCKEGLSEFSWRSKYLVEDFWYLLLKLKDGYNV